MLVPTKRSTCLSLKKVSLFVPQKVSLFVPQKVNQFVPQKGQLVYPSKRSTCLSHKKVNLLVPLKGQPYCSSERSFYIPIVLVLSPHGLSLCLSCLCPIFPTSLFPSTQLLLLAIIIVMSQDHFKAKKPDVMLSLIHKEQLRATPIWRYYTSRYLRLINSHNQNPPHGSGKVVV